MTEAQWLACIDPAPMLTYLHGKVSERRRRLFASACCRRLWHLLPDERSRRAIEAAERNADEETDEQELRLASTAAENAVEARYAAIIGSALADAQARAASAVLNLTAANADTAADYASANAGSAAYHAGTAAGASSASAERSSERARQADVFREVFGNPFRPLTVRSAWLAWNDAVVVRLAQAAYDERNLPAGTLDNTRLAILADALEDAGCMDARILGHLRKGGDHYRGCFVVDALLGKA